MATETFNGTSGNWICPWDVSLIQIECWGGGCCGDNGDGVLCGDGGGGGAYSKKNSYTVVPGQSYAYDAGIGGQSGYAGQNAIFGPVGSPICKAEGGGQSGNIRDGGRSAQGVGDTKYSGGAGAIGTAFIGAGAGSSAGTGANGNPGSGFTGGAAPTGGFKGGNGYHDFTNPQAGTAPGGGSGGGSASGYGETNVPGRIKLTYTPATNEALFMEG